MAFEVWTPPVKPRVAAGTGMSLDQLALLASFGDGYEQTAEDGINAQRETWTLSWPGIKDAHADSIETFWRSKGKTVAFRYTVPGRATQKRYKFNSALSRLHVAGHRDGISVEIREVFDIE